MKVETVSISGDHGEARRVYRATQRVPAASGVPVELIACAMERAAAVRQLCEQLQELRNVSTPEPVAATA